MRKCAPGADGRGDVLPLALFTLQLPHSSTIPHPSLPFPPPGLRLRSVSASQGLMLESASERLMAPGGPHYDCPDKLPSARLGTLEAAGQEGVPFTCGR